MPKVSRTSPPPAPLRGPPPRRGTGVLDRIEDVVFGADDPIQFLVYGRSGTGKTTLWSKFPRPALGIICSGGTVNPGELRSIASKENLGRIKQLRLRASDELWEVIAGVRDGSLPYRTIALDHASGLQDLILKEVLGLEEIPVQKTWGLASREAYGTVAVRFKKFVTAMLDLPANLVLVAHERGFGPDATHDGEIIQPFVGAALTPALSGWLNGSVDYIGQTFVRHRVVYKTLAGKQKRIAVQTKDKEFCLRVGIDPTYATKFRLPPGRELPPVIVDPSYEKIKAIIEGSPLGAAPA